MGLVFNNYDKFLALTSFNNFFLFHTLSPSGTSNCPCTRLLIKLSHSSVVPNLFGTMDPFCGKTVFHWAGWGGRGEMRGGGGKGFVIACQQMQLNCHLLLTKRVLMSLQVTDLLWSLCSQTSLLFAAALQHRHHRLSSTSDQALDCHKERAT